MNDHAYFNLVLRNHYTQPDHQAVHAREWRALNRHTALRLPALFGLRLFVPGLPRLKTGAPAEPCATC